MAVHREAGAELLDRAEEARRRVAEGIELLRSDKLARDAFRFANRAMALQRAHSLWSEHRRRGGSKPLEDFAVPDERRWYPFQLAFVLLNLPSVTDPKHRDRAHRRRRSPTCSGIRPAAARRRRISACRRT